MEANRSRSTLRKSRCGDRAGLMFVRFWLAGAPAPLAVRWLDDDRWQVELPLRPGVQQIELQAYDLQGELVGSSRNPGHFFGQRFDFDFLRVTELHYNPAAPTATEIAAGWTDNEDFEFVELANIGPVTLNLGGVRFVRNCPMVSRKALTLRLPRERCCRPTNRS